MATSPKSLSQWAQEAGRFSPPEWDRLPEIYLYMDQVLSYMDKQLELFERNSEDPLLTSSMVNNYVKAGVLPRPEQKKYSREHLTLLTLICLMKSVLSIPDISALLRCQLKEHTEKDLYETFCSAQSRALQEVCQRVQEGNEKGEDSLTQLAMELSVEASARRTAAERILTEIALQKEPKESPSAGEGKDHSKEKKEKD
ncbi:MAG: DUF1836 domain-containing protein [Hydrogeniiclostridium sp.]